MFVELVHTIVDTQIERRGWHSICENFPTATPNVLIPEFYSNFLNIDMKNLEFDVFLRKTVYHICHDVVASALQIPRVPNPKYPFTLSFVPPRDKIMKLFCGEAIEWGDRKITSTHNFTFEAYVFNLIMCHNLLTVSHRNTIPLPQAQFLYAFKTGVSIDLSFVICNSWLSMHCSEHTSNRLIHPCVITRLLTHLNMTFLASIFVAFVLLYVHSFSTMVWLL